MPKAELDPDRVADSALETERQVVSLLIEAFEKRTLRFAGGESECRRIDVAETVDCYSGLSNSPPCSLVGVHHPPDRRRTLASESESHASADPEGDNQQWRSWSRSLGSRYAP